DDHGQVLLPVGGQQLADDGAEVEEAEAPEPALVAAQHVAVDAELHQVRLHLLEELVDGREEQREADDAPVGPHVGPQAPEDTRVVRLAECLLAVDLGRHQIASSSTSSDCRRKRSAYTPPRASRLSWSPSSTTRPPSSTQIRSASFTVVRRCATRMVVRSRKKPRSWSRMVRSVSASTLESASSRTSTTGRRSQPSGRVRMSRPSRRTLPASTSKRRGRSWTSADFPAPVRPTIATVRPAGTVTSTSSSTGVRSRRPG